MAGKAQVCDPVMQWCKVMNYIYSNILPEYNYEVVIYILFVYPVMECN